MLASNSPSLEVIYQINCDVKIYGSDQFYIYGLKEMLNEYMSNIFDCGLNSLVIKVWTDVKITDSIYSGSVPNDSGFVVICPEQTIRLIQGLPGYEKALFIESSVSVGELNWELVSWLKKISKGRGAVGGAFSRGVYLPGRKEQELITLLLRWGDIRTIARVLGSSDRTLYTRLHKIYSEMGVYNKQEFFMKIQILFEYGLWDKNDFLPCCGG